MKFILAAKDVILTMVVILAFFSLLSFFTQNKIQLSQQQNEIITLMPTEAYLRGSIKIDGDNSITNWRTNKNIVHWKFKCIKEGQYKVSLIHSKSPKKHQVIFNSGNNKLEKEISAFSKESELGVLHLSEGIHEAAFYVADMPKKTKLPAIFSIILTRTN